MRMLLTSLLRVLCLVACVCAGAAAAQDDAAPVAFERETLNAGLGPIPHALDLTSPQTAVESFLAAAEAGEWGVAAHALDLGDIPPDRQPELGPELAQMLYTVLERKVLIRWSDLSERPDAMRETGSGDTPLVGEPRKSLLLGVLDLDGRPVSVRLNRIRAAGMDPVWVFAQSTVENVPALYERHKPSRLERAIPDAFKVETLWGLRLWEVLFLPLAMLLIAASGVAVWRLLAAISRRCGRLVGPLVLSLRVPLTITVVTMLLSTLTTDVVVVSSVASAVIDPLIVLGYVAAAVALVANVIDAILAHVIDTDPAKMSSPEYASQRSIATSIAAARRSLVVVAVVAGLAIVLSSANVFRSLGFSLLASAGVLTLVLGFAAREVLGNILASLQISLNRSARIGDFLEFEGQWCTVERIHFTFVQLKLWTGNRRVVPVSYFVQQPFENWSLVEFKMMRLVTLKLAADADVQPLREAMQRFVERDDRVGPKDEAFCKVTEHDALGMTALFAVPVPVPDAGWDVECELREHLLAEARRQGIEMPSVRGAETPAAA